MKQFEENNPIPLESEDREIISLAIYDKVTISDEIILDNTYLIQNTSGASIINFKSGEKKPSFSVSSSVLFSSLTFTTPLHHQLSSYMIILHSDASLTLQDLVVSTLTFSAGSVLSICDTD